MTMDSQSALEGAKRKLKILVVNPRGMTVNLRDDIDVDVINKSSQRITQQSLRRFDQVLEAELEQPDSDKQLRNVSTSYRHSFNNGSS